ncbi:amidase [Aquihabitans sp. G128]|uniref:amidase n=1 Tax=Aquihabitans sp. G128 TaxID=2849779 RepID=UPI001C219DC0|nr:amidase [Aquihabitans sp. G128]QXC60680.1 amidase [Aquihabitans sp. G128]
MTSFSAFTDDALGTDDVVGLLRRLSSRDVSPSELTAASIARARRADEHLGAIVAERFDAAQREADVHPGGAFGGIPTLIKDMIDVAGLPTRFGSDAFPKAAPAAENDPFAQQLVDLGLTVIAKTTMPEFGFTPSTEFPDDPPTRNPWNLDRSAGGSSGGSAAMVAAGVVPIAHAADGGGSIRIPAACCGLVGLKPSAGRLLASKNTAHQLVPIVVDGVVTRSVRDTAHHLAHAEHLYLNPKLPPIGLVDRALERPLRIGAIDRSPSPGELDGPVRAAFDDTVALLEGLGHRVTLIDPPVADTFVDDFVSLYQLFGAASARAGSKVWGPAFERRLLSEFTEGLGAAFGRRWHRVPGIVRRLRGTRKDLAARTAGYDVLLAPTVAQVPPLLGHLGMDLTYDVLFPRVMEWAQFTPLDNAAGTPSISLPLAHDAATNTPVGIMFSGSYGQERTLLELALQLEAARPWASLAGA